MKKFIKRMLCKHFFTRYWQSAGSGSLHTNQWYYDDWEVDICEKCGKQKSVNEY